MEFLQIDIVLTRFRLQSRYCKWYVQAKVLQEVQCYKDIRINIVINKDIAMET